jgi:sodium transport system ATP-binding protein
MIEVSNLAKRFRCPRAAQNATARDPRDHDGWFHAVRDVSFRCARARCWACSAPTAPAKPPRCACCPRAQPDAGSIHANGIDLLANPLVARQHIGFLSGSTGLYGRLTARENIEYFGRLHGMSPAYLKRRCDELFDLLQMHEFGNKRADQLSTGMKQKCAIARTVVHEPQIVILDEPTTGLDVMSAKILLDFIASYKALRVPLIFSTHHLHEVEKLCDRVCIINHGKTAFHGTMDELRHLGGSADLYDAFVSVVNQEA